MASACLSAIAEFIARPTKVEPARSEDVGAVEPKGADTALEEPSTAQESEPNSPVMSSPDETAVQKHEEAIAESQESLVPQPEV